MAAAAAARRALLPVSICVVRGECVAHQCPGVCEFFLYQVSVMHLLAPSLSFQRSISKCPSQHTE